MKLRHEQVLANRVGTMSLSAKRFFTAWVFGVYFTFQAAVQAWVVNIDFDPVAQSQTYSGQGAYSDLGNNYWNSINPENFNSSFSLKASDGTTNTGVTFTPQFLDMGPGGSWASNYFWGGPGGPLAPALMGDYWYTGGQPGYSFSIGGLTPASTYQFYFYSAVGGNDWLRDRSGMFTLDGVSQRVNGYSSAQQGSALYDSFVLEDNYLIFTTTTNGTSLAGSFYALPGSAEVEFNGLQIVQMAAGQGTSSVPEPGQVAASLLLLSGIGIYLWRRRHAVQAKRRHS